MKALISPGLALLAAVAICVAWMLPHHYMPWVSGYSELASFMAVFPLGLLLTQLNTPLQLPRIVVFFACWSLIPLIQWACGLIMFSSDALITSSYLIVFALTIFIGHNLALEPKRRQTTYHALSAVIIFAAILSSWIAYRQWLLIQPDYSTFEWCFNANSPYRPFANFAQPNHLATLICMAIALVWYLFEERQLNILSSSLLVLFLTGALVLTQSRTPWLGAIAALIWWIWKKRQLPTPRTSIGVIISWIVLFVGLTLSLPALSKLLGLTLIDLMDHATAATRLPLWHQMGMAILHGPLWGFGWNQINAAQLSMTSIDPVMEMTNSGHNILLDLMLWNGPILGLVLIIPAGYWITRLALNAKQTTSIFAGLAVGFILIHGMLEYPLEYGHFLFPFGLMLGLVNGEEQQALSADTSSPSLARPFWIMPRELLALIVLLLVALMIKFDQEYTALDHVLRSPNTTKAEIQRVIKRTVLISQLREELRVRNSVVTPGMSDTQLTQLRYQAYRNSQISSLTRYATALALNHRPAEARHELLHIKALYGEIAYDQALRNVQHFEQLSLDTKNTEASQP